MVTAKLISGVAPGDDLQNQICLGYDNYPDEKCHTVLKRLSDKHSRIRSTLH